MHAVTRVFVFDWSGGNYQCLGGIEARVNCRGRCRKTGHSIFYFYPIDVLKAKGKYYEVGPCGLSFRASNLNG